MRFWIWLVVLLVGSLAGCGPQTAVPVTIEETTAGYRLLRNGTPYYINGAGAQDHYDLVAAAGGNSLRLWGIGQWEQGFAAAEQYGLTICAGMWLVQERQGFDYSDQHAVQEQLERLQEAILGYKDHPALLMWGVGNELDLNYTNTAVWDAVEQVAQYIAEVDGKHPVMTATSFIDRQEVELIIEHCPHIDLLAVNAYGGAPVLAGLLREYGWDRPYILGEWGTLGHWEVATTTWDEPIELDSSAKAALYRRTYQDHILTDPSCLGGYVFFWGNKQERTPTWYGMFLESGEKTAAVDVMFQLWSQRWPENRSPEIAALQLTGKSAEDSVVLQPGEPALAQVSLHDPEGDVLDLVWELLHETSDKRLGGDEEEKPAVAQGVELQTQGSSVRFAAPREEGPYRLFVTAFDQQGSAAHANMPFYVSTDGVVAP